MKRTILLMVLIPLISLILVCLGLLASSVHADDARMRQITLLRSDWFTSHRTDLLPMFTDIFPQAEKCNKKPEECVAETRQLIDTQLGVTLAADPKYQEGRLPIFFVKLKDKNTLEKMYQSGDLLTEKVDTRGERMVVEMLQGKRDPFAYPQHTLPAENANIPYAPYVHILESLLPLRRYLRDFPTQIEQIYLMRNEKNEIMGGLVYLYGD